MAWCTPEECQTLTDFRLTDVSHNQGQMYAVSNVLIVGKQRPDDPTQWATEVSLKIGGLRGIKNQRQKKKGIYINSRNSKNISF